MRFVKFIENDIVDCDDGICVSVWYFGCPHRCKGCHNANLWEDDYLPETDIEEVLNKLISLINKNGIMRNLSFLGGEPLYNKNLEDTIYIAKKIKEIYPEIKIYLWTGYLLEDLQEKSKTNIDYKEILELIDVLIDGPFVLEKRDLTLKLRGSSNQRIFRKNKNILVEK